jgi:hypothetical protein
MQAIVAPAGALMRMTMTALPVASDEKGASRAVKLTMASRLKVQALKPTMSKLNGAELNVVRHVALRKTVLPIKLVNLKSVMRADAIAMPIRKLAGQHVASVMKRALPKKSRSVAVQRRTSAALPERPGRRSAFVKRNRPAQMRMREPPRRSVELDAALSER